jgi:hypothetical protein
MSFHATSVPMWSRRLTIVSSGTARKRSVSRSFKTRIDFAPFKCDAAQGAALATDQAATRPLRMISATLQTSLGLGLRYGRIGGMALHAKTTATKIPLVEATSSARSRPLWLPTDRRRSGRTLLPASPGPADCAPDAGCSRQPWRDRRGCARQ